MSQMRALGELIADARPGFAHGGRSPDGLAQVRMNNVTTRGGWDWSRVVRLPVSEGEVDKYLLRPGDVLFNNTNSTELVGKSACFEGFDEPIVFSNHFTRLRPTAELDARYLAHWLVAQWHSGLFARLCNRWIGQSALRVERLFDIQIPVPPIEIQRRTASLLAERLATVERVADALGRQRLLATALAGSALGSVMSRTAERWPTIPLGEVVTTRPSPSTTSDGDTAILAVTTGCLTPTGFDAGGLRPNRMPSAAAVAGELDAGEVLVSRSNTTSLVGRAALYEGEPHAVTATDLVFRLVPDADRLEGEYLARYLAALQLSGYWRHRSAGASSTMSKITRAQLTALRIPLPPKGNQIGIVAELRNSLAAVSDLSTALDAQLAASKGLPSAVLRAAFGDVHA